MNISDFLDYLPSRPSPTKEKLILDAVHEEYEWEKFYSQSLCFGEVTDEMKVAFHLKWIECGHFICSQINDDDFLCHVLRFFMPGYEDNGLFVY